MEKIKKLYRFIKYNGNKILSIKAFFLSAIYRFQIRFMKPKTYQRWMGVEGKESADNDIRDNYKYAARVAYVVDRICTRTKWESRCLVRARVAQRLLYEKGIHSTLYLGCGLEDDKFVAHSWIRVGELYVTGGNGEEYAMVTKFYR